MIRLQSLLIATLFMFTLPANAALNVFACEPEWAALAQELGAGRVKVYQATSALQDPHHVEARPSLIARVRNADLLVCTGADLESGWLPALLRQAGNANVQPGRPGYFEAARFATLLDKPQQLDRALGDVHSAGNPHIQLDPRNIAQVADALAGRLAEIDPAGASEYRARQQAFSAKWQAALERWKKQGARLQGTPVIVQHKLTYLLNWLGLKEVATLEPKPGIAPGGAYLAEVLSRLQHRPARMIIRAAYNDPRPAEWLAQRTSLPVVVISFSVGGTDQAKDLVTLYDDTLNRLLAALP